MTGGTGPEYAGDAAGCAGGRPLAEAEGELLFCACLYWLKSRWLAAWLAARAAPVSKVMPEGEAGELPGGLVLVDGAGRVPMSLDVVKAREAPEL